MNQPFRQSVLWSIEVLTAPDATDHEQQTAINTILRTAEALDSKAGLGLVPAVDQYVRLARVAHVPITLGERGPVGLFRQICVRSIEMMTGEGCLEEDAFSQSAIDVVLEIAGLMDEAAEWDDAPA